MQIHVSLTIEIGATASLTEMEEHIQEAGQQAMREALKQAIRRREAQTPCCPLSTGVSLVIQWAAA